MKKIFLLYIIGILSLSMIYGQDGYSVTELSEEEYNIMTDSIFHFYGPHSPDDSRWVLFPACEEDPEQYVVIRTDQDATNIDELYVFADAEDIAWSSQSDWFAFIDYDAFYNGGDQCIHLVNVYTEQHHSIHLHHIVKEQNIGNRNHLTVMDLGWLENDRGVVFRLDANFLGTAGDDMIDQHRIEDLGDQFGTNDPTPAGYYMVQIEKGN